MTSFNRHRFRFVVALCVAVVCVPCAAQVGAVFGIQLGRPLNVPECDRSAISIQRAADAAGTCFRKLYSFDPDGRKGDAAIAFPTADAPAWLSGAYVTRSSDESVESILVETIIKADQLQVMRDLVAKYGKPASSNTAIMRNALGEQWPVVSATWTDGAARVLFTSAVTPSSTGTIKVTTGAPKPEPPPAKLKL